MPKTDMQKDAFTDRLWNSREMFIVLDVADGPIIWA